MGHTFMTAHIGHSHSSSHVPQCKTAANIVMLLQHLPLQEDAGLNPDDVQWGVFNVKYIPLH